MSETNGPDRFRYDGNTYDDVDFTPTCPISVEGRVALPLWGEEGPDIIINITGHGGALYDPSTLSESESTLSENMQILFTSIPGGITFTRHNSAYLRFINAQENDLWEWQNNYYNLIREKCGLMLGIPDLISLEERMASCAFAVNPGEQYPNYIISKANNTPILTILDKNNDVTEVSFNEMLEDINESESNRIEFKTLIQYIYNRYPNKNIGIISFTCLTTRGSDKRSMAILETTGKRKYPEDETWGTASKSNPGAPTPSEIKSFRHYVESTSHPEFAGLVAKVDANLINEIKRQRIEGNLDEHAQNVVDAPSVGGRRTKRRRTKRRGTKRRRAKRRRAKRRRTKRRKKN